MSDINIKSELKKGYLMFRAFENGLKLAEEIEGLESTISIRKKALADLELEISSKDKILDGEKKKLADEIAEVKKDADKKKSQINNDFAAYKKSFDAKYKPLEEKIKLAEDKLSALDEKYNVLHQEYADKKASFDLLNKDIEETKAKLRGIL